MHCLHHIVLFYCTNNDKVPTGRENGHFYGIIAITNTITCMLFDMMKIL